MCKHKKYHRKDTELSGGEIYRALICDDCGKEIGHLIFDAANDYRGHY